MEQKLEQLNAWFGQQIAACAERQNALLADDRADEATFEKIRANVYDIFRTVLSAAAKANRGDAGAVGRFFLSRAEQIPESWAASYETAQTRGDAEAMQIERVKLDAAREIKAAFTEVWGESK